MKIYNLLIMLANPLLLRAFTKNIKKHSIFQSAFSSKSTTKNIINKYEILNKLEKTEKATNKYEPKTLNQQLYINYLTNKNTSLVVAVGPAGTGKTLFACKTAIEELKKKQIEKIILTRPLVSVANEDIGFLPGNVNKKMALWVQPMIDIFTEYFPKKEVQHYIETGVIEITPLLYMRGRTFKHTMIIADEIQNTTPTQLLMLLTRCGDGSKIVLTGDTRQSDLKEKNGLVDFIEKYRTTRSFCALEQIQYIELENTDVQRSELVKQILEIYKSPTSSFPVLNETQKYMKKINDAISKIPDDYGDYTEKPKPTYKNSPYDPYNPL